MVPLVPMAADDDMPPPDSVSDHASVPLLCGTPGRPAPVWLALPWNMAHVPFIGCAATPCAMHADTAAADSGRSVRRLGDILCMAPACGVRPGGWVPRVGR